MEYFNFFKCMNDEGYSDWDRRWSTGQMRTQFWPEKFEEKDYLGNPGVDGRIIL